MKSTTTDDVVVRQCQASDLAVAHQLYADLYREVGNPLPSDNLADRMSEYFLVAEKNTKPVGMVLAEYRNKGIGGSLVAAVLDRARKNGIERSMVYSANADYKRTARFYEHCGFKMWHIFMTQ